VLQRDVGRFELSGGTLYLCTPVDGRLCAVVYLGKGRFSLKPPSEIEREQLLRFTEKDSVDMAFTMLFLFVADQTAEELKSHLTFTGGQQSREATNHVQYCLKFLMNKNQNDFYTPFMKVLLDGESNELFYAHFSTDQFKPHFFEINPYEEEEVRYMHRYPHDVVHLHETVSQFPMRRSDGSQHAVQESKERISISNYAIESTITDGLDFHAAASITIRSEVDGQRWIYFFLYPELEVDSVLWNATGKVPFVKGKDSDVLWVQADSTLELGEVCSLMVWYGGELLSETGDLKSSTGWYPRQGFRKKAFFDLRFHVPSRFQFASVGSCISVHENSDMTTYQWTTSRPIRNASFSVGRYKERRIFENDLPPISVMMFDYGNRSLQTKEIIREDGTEGEEELGVVVDVVNSVRFYQHVYGKVPFDTLHASEISDFHGEAFPGLIHLSYATFQDLQWITSKPEWRAEVEEIFRAHEVAHQWWGVGVDFKTYHDQWLSEAFSHFSGLWYMQAALRDNELYFGVLDEWRKEILSNRKFLFGKGQDAGPIWLGYRTHGSDTKGDFDLIVYKKGAWVLHMLRNLMIDLKTMNEDRFKGMMREFYSTYLGKQASTEDFQQIVEKHLGIEMGWFFRQWVYETHVPEYKFAYRTTRTSEGAYDVAVRVEQLEVPDDFAMFVPVTIRLKDNRNARMRVLVDARVKEFNVPGLPEEPAEVIFNDFNSVLCNVEEVDWE
jgi:hypothetical protein